MAGIFARGVWRAGAFILLLTGFGAVASAQLPAPAEDPVHGELRALRDRAVAALTKRDPEALMRELSNTIYFTAMNNESVHGLAEARAYYQRMMAGPASIVEDMSVTVEPDVLSAIYDGGQAAVATGDSLAHFKIRGGVEFTVPLRWTATMVREAGAMKVASLHFSANIFNNPLEGPVLKYLWVFLELAGIAGLVIGFVVGRMRRAG